jgi:light-independent protochlorophyllide reductase subunit B
MKLAYWMYAGPAHIGTLRVASSFKNVHAIMHAPLGDDYFNVMRSMLERERDFTPVTASIVDRHVLARGSQEKVIDNIIQKDVTDTPDLVIVTPTCTSSILQEDLANFVEKATHTTNCDVLLADVNHYRVNELQAADKTLEQVIKFYVEKYSKSGELDNSKTEYPSVNILGMFTLGFHNNHDCRELKRLLLDLGIKVNLVLPEGTSVAELKTINKAWFNIVPYREVGLMAAKYLETELNIPYIDICPFGLVETKNFIKTIENLLNTKNYDPINFDEYIRQQTQFLSQAAWFSRSIDCQNLTGKRAIVFGDSTHAAYMTKLLTREIGIQVILAGTYCKYDSDWFREQVDGFCDQVLITEDHNQIAKFIEDLEPAAIFGTQMERHVGKRLSIPCGVISAPVHIQNFTLSYKPFLGYEGANQIADLIYNSFTLGMEDHLLEIFGGHDTKTIISNKTNELSIPWSEESLVELQKIPGFVRGKVKRNTEKYAQENKFPEITLEIMYKAKQKIGA